MPIRGRGQPKVLSSWGLQLRTGTLGSKTALLRALLRGEVSCSPTAPSLFSRCLSTTPEIRTTGPLPLSGPPRDPLPGVLTPVPQLAFPVPAWAQPNVVKAGPQRAGPRGLQGQGLGPCSPIALCTAVPSVWHSEGGGNMGQAGAWDPLQA